MPPKRPPIRHADCIEIPLTRGLSAFVDLDCPAEILEHDWFVLHGKYAVRNRARPARGLLRLHREILGMSTDDKRDVDHEDGDGFNNRRANLRPCTRQQNMANQGANRGSASCYRGVSWFARDSKWHAQLCWTVDGKPRYKHVGYFDSEEDAARAWDAAALACPHIDQAFLRLNFPAG